MSSAPFELLLYGIKAVLACGLVHKGACRKLLNRKISVANFDVFFERYHGPETFSVDDHCFCVSTIIERNYHYFFWKKGLPDIFQNSQNLYRLSENQSSDETAEQE